MSGDLPDVQDAVEMEYLGTKTERARRHVVAFIQVKVVQGVFTAQQKREIVERLTDAIVEIEGEAMRRLTWCVIEEIASGDWGIGGQPLTVDDLRALARG